MERSYDSIISMGEYRPMVVSPDMSPQLNETICGCRCGCGCGCAGDGHVDENERLSDSETAIASSESEDGDDIPSAQYTPDDRVEGDNTVLRLWSPRAIPRQLVAWLWGESDDLGLGEGLLNQERVSDRPFPCDDDAESMGSPLHDIHATDFRTNALPGHRNVPTMSPGPGLGAWLHLVPEKDRDEHGQHVYIFTPLRLSAEFQHARGMLIPDEVYFQDTLDLE